MGRWGFGRRSRGRHALGAAVTQIPSGPPQAAPRPPLAMSEPDDPDSSPAELEAGHPVPEQVAAPEPVEAPRPVPSDPLLDPLDVLLAAGATWGRSPTPLLEPTLHDAPPLHGAPSSTTGRVQLGFRDGTTASLHPESEQARALEELALMLNTRH